MRRISSTSRGSIRDAVRSLEDSARPERIKAELDAVVESATEGIRATMPIRTGALKASGHWSSEISGDEYTGSIRFGGELAPYAVYVVGRGVNGEHAWDAVLPAHEREIERVLNLEFPD